MLKWHGSVKMFLHIEGKAGSFQDYINWVAYIESECAPKAFMLEKGNKQGWDDAPGCEKW